MDFILTDGSLDRHGERVLPEGVRYSDFEKNPVMFYNHNSMWGSEQRGVIGRWENIRMEGDALVGTAVFDMDDPSSAQIAGKVERGFLNAVSIGFIPKVWSDDEDDKIAGQQGLTIKEAELLEASIVDIPANPNAGKKSFKSFAGLTQEERETAVNNGEVFYKTFSIKKAEQMAKKENALLEKFKNLFRMSANATEEDAVEKLTEFETNIKSILEMEIPEDDYSSEEFKTAVKSHVEGLAKSADVEALKAELNEKIAELETGFADVEALKADLAEAKAKGITVKSTSAAPGTTTAAAMEKAKESAIAKLKKEREELGK